ncbi:Os11g0613200 [Oryza sativa Japonica Group]|uniref:Os11g0613200 protein n=1 Tax=Oryza sativa subsp. japonica TaxID=39947 RepID=A0A0N7KT76_ORYSJ|nr:Os11g0613200 [Oryza sativa Japonica Group]
MDSLLPPSVTAAKSASSLQVEAAAGTRCSPSPAAAAEVVVAVSSSAAGSGGGNSNAFFLGGSGGVNSSGFFSSIDGGGGGGTGATQRREGRLSVASGPRRLLLYPPRHRLHLPFLLTDRHAATRGRGMEAAAGGAPMRVV